MTTLVAVAAGLTAVSTGPATADVHGDLLMVGELPETGTYNFTANGSGGIGLDNGAVQILAFYLQAAASVAAQSLMPMSVSGQLRT